MRIPSESMPEGVVECGVEVLELWDLILNTMSDSANSATALWQWGSTFYLEVRQKRKRGGGGGGSYCMSQDTSELSLGE